MKHIFIVHFIILLIPVVLIPPIHIKSNDENQNVLLIIADDLGLDPVPNYMMEQDLVKAHMPNLEALMARGITFDNIWSNPTCSPTRATILTGRYGFRTNVLSPQESGVISIDEYTLHQNLTEGGNGQIASTIIGKWHLSGNGRRSSANVPSQMGIEDYTGLYGGGVADYYDWDMVVNGNRIRNTDYITSVFTDAAIDWINQQDTSWFAWVAYTAPHTPFHLPPDGTHTQTQLSGTEADISDNPLPYYIAMIENLDYEVGRLLDGIPDDELEKTTIIFVGDNGTARQVIQEYTRQQAKGSIYQGGINVPMVIAGHGVSRENVREDALINLVDLFPTIGDLFDVDSPENIDGQSFVSVLNEENVDHREWVFSEGLENSRQQTSNARIVTIRNTRYKLIDAEIGEDELYNLVQDPYETTNLMSEDLDSTLQAEVDALRNILTDIGARRLFD